MTLLGNTGKILEINLTKEKTNIIKLGESAYRRFLGGSGLAAYLLYDKLTKQLDPLSAENPLAFFTGPLVGTKTPNCGRHVVCAKSPLTGIWGEANSGGKFGAYMKFLGFDGLLFTGKAKTPVYVTIFDEGIEIRDGNKLVGLDSFEVGKKLEQQHEKISSYACIGLAGENLVKIASVMNEGDRAAGRTGMGAVMGSKNLKAIALRSSNRSVDVADSERMKELGREMRKYIREHSIARTKFGTAAYVSGGMKWGDVPVKYWYKGHMDNTEAIDGARMKETILTKRYHCYGCVIGCGRVIKIDEGKYKLPETAGAEYETLAGFGTNLLIDNLEGISYANYLCNAYGLDTISSSMVIGLLYHLKEQGVVPEEDLYGLEADWGDIDTVLQILEMIAKREGIGDILADGADETALHYQVPEEAHTVNGLELPYHDPRAFFSMATVYATSSRGACHNNGDGYKMGLGVTVPEIDLKCEDRFDDVEAGRLAAKVQDFRAVYNGLIMCHFAMPTFTNTVKMLSYATGWDYSIVEVMTAGERINNLKRLLNRKMGLTKCNDSLPKIMKVSLEEGGTEGKLPDLETQLKEYYQIREWNPETGFPTKDCLQRLDLQQFG
jgi:aldehyde:ferredoxin oxidoreductase